jgi:hypothetical protein
MKRWLLLLAAVPVLAGAVWLIDNLRRPYRGYSGNVMLVIEPGTRAPEVAQLLASRGVLAYRLPFLLLHEWGRTRHHMLKAG